MGVATTYNPGSSRSRPEEGGSLTKGVMRSRRASRRAVLRAGLAGALGAPLWAHAQTAANASRSGLPVRTAFGKGDTLIAVLVPPKASGFDRATDCLIAGVRAAHAANGSSFTVEAIEVNDEAQRLEETLGTLKERGFAMAIGPITRNGANSLLLLERAALPTLALNLPDGDLPRAGSRAVFFSLAIESEARQAAAQAFAQALPLATRRKPRAAAIVADNRLGLRGAVAFSEEWLSLGGEMLDPIEFAGSRPPRDLKSRFGELQPDVVFAAMAAEQARNLRRDLGKGMIIWGTSLASIGGSAPIRMAELDGLRLFDMPWLVQPDSPPAKAYRKAPSSYTPEMQRLYALGIDAFRVTRRLIDGDVAFELDGVTGRLRFEGQVAPRVDRVSVPVEYRNGRPVPMEPGAGSA